MPTYTKADTIAAAAQGLTKVSTQDAPLHIGQKDSTKLIELTNIFNRVAKKLPMQETENKSANKTKDGNHTTKTPVHHPTTTPYP